jgi:hypothetical protein
MAIQSLEQFRTTFASQPVEVELPQFAKDGAFSVFLRPLKSRDRDNFEASVVGMDGQRDLHNLRARLVALCWCNEEGNPIGSEDEVGDLRADFVGALFDKVRELNGMDSDDVDEAGKG